MASVALEMVGKVYSGGVAALRDVDLTVADGELLVLLGPSGCGKTTVLRLIAGLERPSQGEIRLGGRLVTRCGPRFRRVAMIFQNSALYPHLSVYRNLAFGLELRWEGGLLSRMWRRVTQPGRVAELAVRRRAMCRAVQDMAELLGIEHLLDRMPRQLSGGERQRVALGRALVRQPAVFLLDEPLSSLDARLRFGLCRELRELQRRLRVTIVYVTHDQTEAMTLGDRIAVMQQGRIQQVGTPEAIYDRPRNRFVATFVGYPPMNVLGGSLDDVGGTVWFRSRGLAVPLRVAPRPAGRQARLLELGVRPESVVLTPAAEVSGGAATAAHGYGMVAEVESLGDHRLVYVDLEAAGQGPPERLVCRMGRRPERAVGERVAVEIGEGGIHLFDVSSGQAWRAGDAPPGGCGVRNEGEWD